MSLTKDQITEYRTLKDSGVDVSKHNVIKYNGGSESVPHICSKSLVGLLGIRNGYRVDSEVEVKTRKYGIGEIDTLLWGHPERLTYAVESQSSPTQKVKTRKKEQYVDETAIDDIQFVNVTQLPPNMMDAFGEIGATLGLEP